MKNNYDFLMFVDSDIMMPSNAVEIMASARIDVLKKGIMENEISKSVWAAYRHLVDPDFAIYFEREIYPGGLDQELEAAHPLSKVAR